MENKKYAYTLAEILICLIIIGFLAIIMIRSINSENFTKKHNIASAYKALEVIKQASLNIMQMEKTNCPMQAFMVDVAGNMEYALVNSSNNPANSSEVADLFGKYIKFEQEGINFCDNSGYCTNSNIKGARIGNSTYVGFEITGVINCPNYYLPGDKTEIQGAGKCWGKLYIDTNGTIPPDTIGEDVFVFGLNKDGVHY